MALTKITSNIITDGAITTDDLATTTIASISGSGNQSSSSLASRVTVTEASSSNINQDVKSSASPTFAGGTITGDFSVGGILTAQEFHTEFESASIIYTSGSNKFGDSSDDVHHMSGSLRITGSGDHYIQTGNVGIGTTSPGEAIHVRGSEPTIKVQEDGSNHYVELEGGGTTAFINFYDSLRFREGTTERMRIDGSGNVGIGATSLTHKLTIGDASASDFVIALRGGVGGFFGWDDSANTTIVQAPNTRQLSFRVNSDTFGAGTEAIRIDSSGNSTFAGNVGVGGAPADEFSIHGGGNVMNFNVDSTTMNIRRHASGGSSTDWLVHYFDGSRTYFSSAAGSIGIGTTNPTNYNANADNLVIFETGDDSGITLVADNTRGSNIYFADAQDDNVGGITYNHSSNFMNFRVNGIERMRINSSGFVGIGDTTSGNALLDINKSTTSDSAPTANESFEGFRLILANPQLTNYATNALGFSMYNGEVCASIDASTLYDGNYRTSIRFQTRDDQNSGLTEKVTINYGGNILVRNNQVGNAGLIRNGSSASYTNGSYNSITSGEAGAFMLYAYDTGSGKGACFFCTYSGTAEKVAGHSDWTNSDTASKFCVFKSANSHTTTIKNNIGSTANIGVLLVGVNPKQGA